MILDQVRLASRFKLFRNGELDEFSDRLSYKFSCFILFAISGVILIKQYFTQAISCYIANDPGGSRLLDYIENYCWVQGIIPISFNDKFPTSESEWQAVEKYKIMYYQWIPFVLYAQGIMCYIPNIIWRLLNINVHNTDFRHIISRANKAQEMDETKRKTEVIRLAKALETMLLQRSEIDREQMSKIRGKFQKLKSYFTMWNKIGIPLIAFYIFVKLLYVLNSVGQILLMQSFLNLDRKNYAFFGTKILHDIATGKDWQVSLVFPRVGYCFAKVRQLAVVNYVTAQCALPINMLNEKIYILLWFWMLFLSIASIVSLVIWIIRVFLNRNKTDFLKMYLTLSGDYKNKDLNTADIQKFERFFLKHDGMFLLRMMASNAGDVITSEVVSQLWQIFTPKYDTIKVLNIEKLEQCFTFGKGSTGAAEYCN